MVQRPFVASPASVGCWKLLVGIAPKLSTELYDVKCEQLKVGDIFIDDEDAQIELLNIMKVNGEFKTYTFSTDSKTYYANKLLVHSEI